ncbi:response regulator [Nocardioides sp. GCM10027113]|uniref:response regulator n=1 Tax=unclassified Nocardioides TaxID=2615069 RepID=UPI00362274CE
MKVLVADDSRVMRQLVVRALRQAGYGGHDVLHAADGKEALEAALRERPDLVLADWNLPGLAGLETLTALRAAGVGAPFGFVTADASEQVRDHARAAGAAFLIAKPFGVEDFEEALAGLLPVTP